MIPDYDVVVVDEAHELVARVTQAATDELAVNDVERAARRSQRHVGESNAADDLADAGDALQLAMDDASPGRFDEVPEALKDALVLVRDAARACLSAYPREAEGTRWSGRCRRCRPHPGPRAGAGGLRERRADGCREQRRRALAERGRRPHPAAAVRRAAAGVEPDARQAAVRQDGGVHLGHLDARRRLLLDGRVRRPQAGRAHRRHRRFSGPVNPDGGRRGPALARARRRVAVRLRRARRSSTSPATCRRPVATGSARPSSTRSSSSSTPRRAAPSGCSAHAGPPRRRRPRCANACPT